MQECKHRFSINKVFDSKPIVQFLTCNKCGQQFFGYDGEVGNPIVIHPMKKPMEEKQFKNMLTTSIDLKVK